MKSTVAVFMAAFFTKAVLANNITLIRIGPSSRFYVTANSGFHDQLVQDCASIGYKLAILPFESELYDLNKVLLGQTISTVWVGGRISPTLQECCKPQMFKSDCWEWSGFQGPQPITNNGATWNNETYSKWQDRYSRTIYDLSLLRLDLANNTELHRGLCESEPSLSI